MECNPFKETYGAETFFWNAAMGLRSQEDTYEIMDLTVDFKAFYIEFYTRTGRARSVVEKQQKKTLKKLIDEVGKRVLVYDNEGDIGTKRTTSLSSGLRKLRRPCLLDMVLGQAMHSVHGLVQAAWFRIELAQRSRW